MASLSSGSSSGSESDPEEDTEPILNYARYHGTVTSILENDSLSAMTICATITVLGSHNGIVYVLDSKGKEIKRYRAHSAAVTDVSIDSAGQIIASASLDGRLVLYNVQTKETSMYDFKRPLRCAAIDPEYANNGRGRVLSGGLAGLVIMNEKGWMGTKETILSAKEGAIMAISWHKNLVAWANDNAVCVYDVYNARLVGRIDRKSNSARADLFKCRLLWQHPSTLYIGWFDLITKVNIQEGIGKVLNLEVVKVVRVDYIICGLAFLEENLLVMAYMADLAKLRDVNAQIPTDSERPEIRILNAKFEEISEDALGIKTFSKLQPNDYALLTQPGAHSFIIVAPKDVISARKRTDFDHIQYLVDMKRFEEAMASSRDLEGLPLNLTYLEIGKLYITFLLGKDDYSTTARILPEILQEDVAQWEIYISLFIERGQLDSMAEQIPYDHPTLSSKLYEDVLKYYLSYHHFKALLKSIQTWPIELYQIDQIISLVKDELLLLEHKAALQECLATLYLKDDRPREALPLYLALGKSETFNLISEYHLFDAIQDDVVSLLTLDTPSKTPGISPLELSNHAAVDMLIDHIHSIPMAKVIAQIRDRPDLLYAYFEGLLKKDLEYANQFSDLQIATFADYDRTRLMDILKISSTYSFEKAMQICQQRDFVPEMVFILGRTGENKKALKLIIEKLDDVQQAIDFAMLQADPELWEDLIAHSLGHPRFIRGLLENATSVIDPVALLRRIPRGVVIEGLKDSLLKIFSDYDLQLSLSQCGRNIHRNDTTILSSTLHRALRRGRLFLPKDVKKTMIKDDEVGDVFVTFSGTILSKRQLGIADKIPKHRKISMASKVSECARYRTQVLTALTAT